MNGHIGTYGSVPLEAALAPSAMDESLTATPEQVSVLSLADEIAEGSGMLLDDVVM